MKTAIVTDSNTGLSKELAAHLDIHILPMPFSIDGEDYLDGVNLTVEDFFNKQGAGADIMTSQPNPMQIIELWDRLLLEYDEILHIPMSSALSTSCETAMMLSRKDTYDGKVLVVDNRRISITQYSAILDAKELLAQGKSTYKVKEILEENAKDATIYLTVDTLKFLKKGGRITPLAAALGTLLKIKPVLQLKDGKIDSYAKARTLKQAKSMMLSAVQSDVGELLKDETGENSRILIAHCHCLPEALAYREEVKEVFKNSGEIEIFDLSLSVATHVGAGTLAIAAARKIV